MGSISQAGLCKPYRVGAVITARGAAENRQFESAASGRILSAPTVAVRLVITFARTYL